MAFAGETHEKHRAMKPQEVSGLAWAFADLNSHDINILPGVTNAAMKPWCVFSQRCSATLSWALEGSPLE
eukprot:CAMPEP_0185905534 /NCGR_PEP_ID=MMETSP0196C-20130402/4741_1 /TAXON_ID=2932 /ORGANISM="Alexandrium fundyense, Strain CCMP1719" /LENGTH=69 /DNA_ID=CAMNT_0028625085 /DNA_START=22 /DNA_END=228 /DNA_ORIENTATION=+